MLRLLKTSLLLWIFMPFLDAQNSPSLDIKTDSIFQLSIADLKINVQIIGNIATTTMDMNFYNPLDRELEGEFNFPLGEGQTVVRYALDINGKLREGVVVEKQQGRQAFERIIRKKIDPGLLEMTEGNNFRTRVFPIPAKGYKRLAIAYEQELGYSQSSLNYQLPLNFSSKVQNFEINIEIIDQSVAPIFQQPKEIEFKKQANGSFVAFFKAKNYLPNQSFKILIPTQADKPSIFYESNGQDMYFYAIAPVNTLVKEVKKQLPKSIALFWDVSASAANRNVDKELKLLGAYLQQLKNCKVQLITFSNAVHEVKNIALENGHWELIRQFLVQQPFDGGTQLGALDFTKYKADEILLFTDGLNNIGTSQVVFSKTPVIVINSSATANHSYLRYLAIKSSGQYINLNTYSSEEAYKILTTPPLQFIKATYAKGAIEEVYPTLPSLVQGQFSCAGKLKQEEAKLTLHFGNGNRTVYTQQLFLTKKHTPSNSNVARIWANKKVSELDMEFEKNKKTITALGKAFSIVTRNTSLIVLDRVEDYVQYEIVPPAELRQEYERLLKEKKSQLIQKTETEEEEDWSVIQDAFEDLVEWWAQDFTKQSIPPKATPVDTLRRSSPQQVPTPQNQTISTPVQDTLGNSVYNVYRVDSIKNVNLPNSPLSGRIITGIVTDENGDPLIGASILAKGTATGTVTDVEGKYSLQVPEGITELVVSYTGFNTAEIHLDTDNTKNVVLSSGMALSEVVVTGYGSQTRNSLTAAVSRITTNDVGNVLQARAAGIQVLQNGEGIPTAIVQGGKKVPLDSLNKYFLLIDEYPATAADFEEVSDEIVNIKFLEGKTAINLYGAKAANGAIIAETQWRDFEPDQKDSVIVKQQTLAYLDSLEKVDVKARFAAYLILKQQFPNTPTFFLDIANFFFKHDQKSEGLRILSNIAELDLENVALLRILGHALQQQGAYNLAVPVFQKILDLRPDEPQSYRDLGLAYEKIGKYQEALNLLNEVLKNFETYDNRFSGIEGTLIFDINGLIARHYKKLDLSEINSAIVQSMPVDIRIVLNWSNDATDVDLHVVDPTGEECYYKHSKTAMGGYLYEDITEGYGPEQFTLKKAKPGTYKIKVTLYSDSRQRAVEGIVFQAYAYLYYGTPKQQEYAVTVRIDTEKEEADIMQLVFK